MPGRITRPRTKPIPPLSLNTLLPPSLRHTFFEDAHNHPFKPHAKKFEWVNAWWLAEASLLAYDSINNVKTHFTRVGFTLTGRQPFTARKSTQCYVAHHDQCVIVAFRGTQVPKRHGGKSWKQIWQEVLYDIAKILQFHFSGSRGKGFVHEGFKQALDEIWDDQILRHLSELKKEHPHRPIWFTGHSLGGALATLAARRFPKAHAVYTFGAPRVGNAAFAKHFPIPTHRFVNGYDFVPHIPVWGLNFFKFLLVDQYQHVGTSHLLRGKGVVTTSPSDWLALKRETHAKKDWGILISQLMTGNFHHLPGKWVTDHAPLYYTLKVWNAYVTALAKR